MIKLKFVRLSGAALLAALCAGMPAGTALGEPFIVKDGSPRADIIIADQPPRMVKLAALELQAYVEKMSGARLPVATAPLKGMAAHVYVGKSKYTDELKITDTGLNSGAFRIVSGKDFLVLLGRDRDFTPPPIALNTGTNLYKEWDALTGEKWGMPFRGIQRRYSPAAGISDYDGRGSLNAVYEFLESLGLRWYMPGDLGEVAPERKTIELAQMDKTVKPDFNYRDLGDYSPHFDGGPRDSVLWRLRMRFSMGEEIVGLGGFAHSLNLIHGREEVKQAHPEYFALYNGLRATNHMHSGAPCLSSPGLFDSTVKYARFIFNTYPDQPAISVMPNDGYVSLCQCELCKGKDTPERGYQGQLSDYVWDFTERVARELYKTHPEKKIINDAYGPYLLPPLKIKKFSPNVMVAICEQRFGYADPQTYDFYMNIRKGYLEKVNPGNFFTGGHYLYTRPKGAFAGVPVFFPHMIANDLRALRGVSQGEFIELSQGAQSAMHAPGINHLNVYVTGKLYWDAGRDVDEMLSEYYREFYGPAAGEMKKFMEYCEVNWPLMKTKVEPIDKAMELLAKARKAAGDTVYSRRIDVIIGDTEPVKELREKLAVGRKGAPQAVAAERKNSELKLDGKLDEPFWKDVPVYELKDLSTGKPPAHKTFFQVAWSDTAIVFGIRCEEDDIPNLNIATRKNEDSNLWSGDAIEVHLETQTHSYYQVAINPAGAIIDADRRVRVDTMWNSEAEVAASANEKEWCVEVRFPVVDNDAGGADPLKKVEGRKPTATSPWYFNIGRQRIRKGQLEEASAFSPTFASHFHVPLKFGELVVK
ncbi:MAG: DUF4838 domain-containing protein [Kiritimatiellia bacterium]